MKEQLWSRILCFWQDDRPARMNGKASSPSDMGLCADGSQRDAHPILSLPRGDALWEDCRRHQRRGEEIWGSYNWCDWDSLRKMLR